MQVLSRAEFIALEGSVLFSEVVLEEGDANTYFVPKPHTDHLMVRRGHAIDGSYYESAISEFSLTHLFSYAEGNGVWKSFIEELDLTATRGCHENEYFLVYDKEDVKNIIKLLMECL